MLNDIHKPADKRKHVNDKQYSRVNRCVYLGVKWVFSEKDAIN